MIPNCREVARLISSGELEQKGPWASFFVRLHFLMCEHCSRYAREMENLARLFRRKFHPAIHFHKVQRLADRILQGLS